MCIFDECSLNIIIPAWFTTPSYIGPTSATASWSFSIVDDLAAFAVEPPFPFPNLSVSPPSEGQCRRDNWGPRAFHRIDFNWGPRHIRAYLTHFKRFLELREKICLHPRKLSHRHWLVSELPLMPLSPPSPHSSNFSFPLVTPLSIPFARLP